MNTKTARGLKPPSGMVLLLCLIFLTTLTLLGLSAAADTILQNQLSANLQESERARQSSMAALAWAEQWLLGLEGPAPEVCTTPCEGLYLHGPGDLPSHPESKSLDWWITQGQKAGINPLTGERITTVTGGNKHPPVWVIEVVHSIPPESNSTGHLRVWYRILARGSGHSDTAISVIESTVVRSWPLSNAPEPATADDAAICPGAEHPGKCRRVSWRELR